MSLFASDKPAAEKGGGGDRVLTLHFDGGSRGNPGPAGIGVVLLDEKKRPVYELGEFLGNRTSNFSEYTALVRGLTAAKILGATKVQVKADSELVVRQINGVYKVKSPDLLPLYRQAMELIGELGGIGSGVTVVHVYREGNARADELANMAMDRMGKIEPLGPPGTVGGKGAAAAAMARDTGGEEGEEISERSATDLSRFARALEAVRRVDEKMTVEQVHLLVLIAAKPGRTAGEVGDELKRTAGAVMRVVMDSLIVRHEFVYADNRDGEGAEDRLFVTEKGERVVRQVLEGLGE